MAVSELVLQEPVSMASMTDDGHHGPTVAAISVRQLTKVYGSAYVVRGVDLDVKRGEAFALLGPNGAGKTTTVEILEGYRKKTSGSVSVLGIDPADSDDAWRARIGIVLQTSGHFDEMRVDEITSHYRDIYGSSRSVDEVLSLTGLAAESSTRCGRLSGGQKRRLDLALAVIGDPELLFLDEPTTGFDPEARHQAWDLIASLKQHGTTVFLTTHFMDEAERLADRVAVIRAGQLVTVATPSTLVDSDTLPEVTVSFRLPDELASSSPPRLRGVKTRREDGRIVAVTTTPTTAIAAFAAWAAKAGITELPGLSIHRASLEETYLRLVRDEPT